MQLEKCWDQTMWSQIMATMSRMSCFGVQHTTAENRSRSSSLQLSLCQWSNQLQRIWIKKSHAKPWASYQIRKIAGCACAGNAGNVFPRRRFQMKPLVSDPGMHHGTCVTHVPWCMSGSLTCGDGENVPGIPGACAPVILRIWQEAHVNI